MDSYIKHFELVGECEIDIDKLIKVWDNRFYIGQYDSVHYGKTEFTLIEYAKEFEEATNVKAAISELQAKEIIKTLNLIAFPSAMFPRSTTWQTEERANAMANYKG